MAGRARPRDQPRALRRQRRLRAGGHRTSARGVSPLARRARGRPLEQIVPVGLTACAPCSRAFLDVGFSKFIVRPMAPPAEWRAELERLAGAVGDLQT